MSPGKHALLLGGHGKVLLHATPLLLTSGYTVTSVIREQGQTSDILNTAATSSEYDKLEVLVSSLDDVKSVRDAEGVIAAAEERAQGLKVDTLVWSAGAGGKGGASRTFAIDRDAAQYFSSAALASPTIKTFLLVSALVARRKKAPWWSDKEWSSIQHNNKEVMPNYIKAKIAADEFLTLKGREATKKNGAGALRYLILRPGGLTDGKGTGKCSLGKTVGDGKVARADVAAVAAEMLRSETLGSGWYDLQSGEEDIAEAIERVRKEGFDSVEGEDVEAFGTEVVL